VPPCCHIDCADRMKGKRNSVTSASGRGGKPTGGIRVAVIIFREGKRGRRGGRDVSRVTTTGREKEERRKAFSRDREGKEGLPLLYRRGGRKRGRCLFRRKKKGERETSASLKKISEGGGEERDKGFFLLLPKKRNRIFLILLLWREKRKRKLSLLHHQERKRQEETTSRSQSKKKGRQNHRESCAKEGELSYIRAKVENYPPSNIGRGVHYSLQ